MKKILNFVLLLFVSTVAIYGKPTVQFTASTITVRQDAGIVELPMTISGAKDATSSQDPAIHYNTQSGTASSANQDYRGISEPISFPNYNGISGSGVIQIPIYFTGATVDKFFTVILQDGSGYYDTPFNALVGSPSAITVTILGYQPPPKPVAQFTSTSISVRQDAGILNIPVSFTGPKDSTNVADPAIYAETQAGSTSSGYGYNGFSKTAFSALNYNGVSGFAYVSIPIKFTGDTSNKFFTVLLSPTDGYSGSSSTATVGSPSAITVTILGYQPPAPVYYFITVKPNSRTKGFAYGTGIYVENRRITVSARARRGRKFVKWTENGRKVSGSSTYSFIVSRNVTLVANFR